MKVSTEELREATTSRYEIVEVIHGYKGLHMHCSFSEYIPLKRVELISRALKTKSGGLPRWSRITFSSRYPYGSREVMSMMISPHCRDHDLEKLKDKTDNGHDSDSSDSDGHSSEFSKQTGKHENASLRTIPHAESSNNSKKTAERENTTFRSASHCGFSVSPCKGNATIPGDKATNRGDKATNDQAHTFSDSEMEDTDWNDLNNLETMARKTAGLNDLNTDRSHSMHRHGMGSESNVQDSKFKDSMAYEPMHTKSNPSGIQCPSDYQSDDKIQHADDIQQDNFLKENEFDKVETFQDDDCVIVEETGCQSQEPSVNLGGNLDSADALGGTDDDVVILQAEGDFTDDLPHLRESCPKHPFNTQQAIHACKNCFCMVCDTNWSLCKHWSNHCKAKFDNPKWIAERNKIRCGYDDKTLRKHLKDIFDSIADLSKVTKRSIRAELERRVGAEEGKLECRKQEISDWIMEHLDKF
eukprot:748882-Hanusia_phi.AAC.2